MTTAPTTTQVEARLETLPGKLRSAVFSLDIAAEAEKIGLANGLLDGDLPFLSDVVVWVFMGFLHSSDTAQAIEDHVDVDTDTAKAISRELSEKIFKPYNADLEKTYTPMTAAPAKMFDISSSAAPAVSSIPAPMPAAKPPVTAGAPVTAPSMPSAMPEPKAWQPSKLTVPGATTGPTPATPKPAAPAPFMMHEESSAAPLATGSDFKLNLSKDMFKSAPTKPIEIPRPPKAAELEIGKAPLPPKPPGVTSFRTAPTSQSRVVHYTDMKTTVSPSFGPAQPPVGVPPAAPKPIAPAIPAAVPMPQPIAKPPVTIGAPAAPKAPSMPTAMPAMPNMAKPMAPSAPSPLIPTDPTAWKKPATMPNIPAAPTGAPATPAGLPAIKPIKVVNFGPEEVK